MISRRLFVHVTVLAALFAFSLGSLMADDKLSADKIKALYEAPPYGEKIIGKADAPITIVEYASLTCSHCAAFHTTVLPKLKEKYIDTGKVKLLFRGYTLNPLDTAAQMLTHCAGGDKFFPLSSAFFSTQKSWLTAADPVAALLQVSKQAGFTQESFETCLRNQKLLDEINTVRDKASKTFGVEATPTFFINGELHRGEVSFDALDKIIQQYLKS